MTGWSCLLADTIRGSGTQGTKGKDMELWPITTGQLILGGLEMIIETGLGGRSIRMEVCTKGNGGRIKPMEKELLEWLMGLIIKEGGKMIVSMDKELMLCMMERSIGDNTIRERSMVKGS